MVLCFCRQAKPSLNDVAPLAHRQGRDNELVAWRLATSDASLMTLPSRIQADLPVPERMAHVGINALNYCPFSAISAGDGTDGVLVAVPHTLDSGYVDIVHLPSGERRSRAVGKPDIQATKDRARACRWESTISQSRSPSR